MRAPVVKSRVGVFFFSRPLFSSPPASRVQQGSGSRAAKPAQRTPDPLPTPKPKDPATEFPFSLPIWGLAEEGGAPRSRRLFYPCRPLAGHPMPHSLRAIQASLLERPHLYGGAPKVTQPGVGRASSMRIFHRASSLLQNCPFRDHAGFKEAPQRHQQLARQGDDSHPPRATTSQDRNAPETKDLTGSSADTAATARRSRSPSCAAARYPLC